MCVASLYMKAILIYALSAHLWYAVLVGIKFHFLFGSVLHIERKVAFALYFFCIFVAPYWADDGTMEGRR